MLVSHRAHRLPWDDAHVRLDRVLAERWTVRHVVLHGVVTDERVSRVLGRGVPEGRARLHFVARGRSRLFLRDGGAFELGEGEFALRPRIDAADESGAGATLEIDFAAGEEASESSSSLPWERGRLGARARAALAALAEATAGASAESLPRFDAALADALAALRAEGLAVRIDRAAPSRVSPEDDRYIRALDATLSALVDAPALIDLETRLGCDRRTVVRRTHAVHARHGLHGLSGTDFRAVRDFYRLLVAVIALSHSRATTEGVARLVGYASPQALCHAFHRVGLPSPQALREHALRASS